MLKALHLKNMGRNKPTPEPVNPAPVNPAPAPVTVNLYRRKKGSKGKTGSKGKFTRMHAVCAVLLANPTQAKLQAVQAADDLFTKETGKGSNTPETYRRYRMAVIVLAALNDLKKG